MALPGGGADRWAGPALAAAKPGGDSRAERAEQRESVVRERTSTSNSTAQSGDCLALSGCGGARCVFQVVVQAGEGTVCVYVWCGCSVMYGVCAL